MSQSPVQLLYHDPFQRQFTEDLQPKASSYPKTQYNSMDPFHFFENNLMKEILANNSTSENESNEEEFSTPKQPACSRFTRGQEDFIFSSEDEVKPYAKTQSNSDSHIKRVSNGGHVMTGASNEKFKEKNQSSRRKLFLRNFMDQLFETPFNEKDEKQDTSIAKMLKIFRSENIHELIRDH